MEETVNMAHEIYSYFSQIPKITTTLFLNLIVFSFAACAPVSSQETIYQPAPAAEEPIPVTEVFFYPNKGQSEAQQDRDQYECYLWAKQQTGFDPSRPNLAPHHRVRVVPQPAIGHDTVVGAAAGAVIGAAVGGRSHAGRGAVVGAIAGAMVGAASDSSRNEQAQRIQQQYEQDGAAQYADSEKKARNYRRALGACLEGRGYTVR